MPSSESQLSETDPFGDAITSVCVEQDIFDAMLAVCRTAKGFCDCNPMSSRKQQGSRVGLHRAVERLRRLEQ